MLLFIINTEGVKVEIKFLIIIGRVVKLISPRNPSLSDVAELVSNFVQKKRSAARKNDLMQNLSECWSSVRDKVEFAEHGKVESL